MVSEQCYPDVKKVLFVAWILCLLLTVADWLTPLEMIGLLRTGAHCGLVLLFICPVTESMGGIALTKDFVKFLAGTTLALLILFWVSMIFWPLAYVTLPLISYSATFFNNDARWRSEYVYYRRGPTLMVKQVRYGPVTLGATGVRYVQVTPISQLFQWATPLPEQPSSMGYAGWKYVQQDWVTFTRTPAEQLLFETNWHNRPLHLAAQKREDSLVRIGKLPTAAFKFPGATQQGANTMGFLLGSNLDIWRDYAFCFDDTRSKEVSCGVSCSYIEGFKDFEPYGYRLEVHGSRNLGAVHQYVSLHLAHVTGPGKYFVGAYHDGNDSFIKFEGTVPPYVADYGYYTTLSNRLSYVNITRIDTVAHIIAGTFEAFLREPGLNYSLIMRNGRFDINYKAPFRISNRRMQP